jgi:hypothetical protein
MNRVKGLGKGAVKGSLIRYAWFEIR